jgi:hypothetical protein
LRIIIPPPSVRVTPSPGETAFSSPPNSRSAWLPCPGTSYRLFNRPHRRIRTLDEHRRGDGQGNDPEGEKRYSPAKCMGIKCDVVSCDPDGKHISTSYVERQNLTMRMSMRRFTRPTNAFSKKAENHAAAVALYFMFYNFARVHQTLRVTPAMEAGISDHVWSIEEIVRLLDSAK